MTTVPTVQSRRLAPPIAFRNVARPLPGDMEWQRGYSFASYCDEAPTGMAYCEADPTIDERTASTTLQAVYPFWIDLGLACDQPIVDPTELLAEQADTIEKATDWALAHELWNPEWRLGNPADPAPLSLLYSVSGWVTAASATLAAAMSALLDMRFGLTCCATSGGIWHIPPQLIPAALDANLVTQVQNRYVGPMGYDVIADAGYGPVAHQASGGGGDTYVWLTGPVRYAVGPVELHPDAEDARRWNPRRNRYEVWARRLAVVEVDPCCILYASVAYNVADVTAVPDPVVEDIEGTVDQTPYPLDLTFAVVSGTPTAFVIDTTTTHGTLVYTGPEPGHFVYTPAVGYVGDDSFTFHATTAEGASNVATGTLHVEAL